MIRLVNSEGVTVEAQVIRRLDYRILVQYKDNVTEWLEDNNPRICKEQKDTEEIAKDNFGNTATGCYLCSFLHEYLYEQKKAKLGLSIATSAIYLFSSTGTIAPTVKFLQKATITRVMICACSGNFECQLHFLTIIVN
jgi:hypothetical protein